jgi:hypothetical protein
MVLVAIIVAACGSTASPAPVVSGSPGSPQPKPTSWPGPAVLAIIKLGGADGEIAKAGQDFTAAADASDIAALWGAADGLVPVIEDLISSVDPLEQWDMTADLGAVLRKAYPLMLEGATLLRDSIIAGDVAGVEEGSRKLAEGLAAYAPARPILADLVPQALLQQRHFNL